MNFMLQAAVFQPISSSLYTMSKGDPHRHFFLVFSCFGERRGSMYREWEIIEQGFICVDARQVRQVFIIPWASNL
jgi:hypothetical protein